MLVNSRTADAFVRESNSEEGRALKLRALRQLPPDLSDEHLRAIASFVNESNSLEGRAVKLNGLVELFRIQPALTPGAVRAIGSSVNGSETIEGRRSKLSGFAQFLRAHPDASEEVLAEVGAFVSGSNSIEGYSVKFRYLSAMPPLTPSVLRSLRRFVDESNGVPGRELKLRHMQALLQKNPKLDAATLDAIAGYVNESNSLDGRGTKLGFLVQHPTLSAAQIRAIASGVNQESDVPSRRLAQHGFAEILKLNGQAPLAEISRFVACGASQAGRREYYERSLQVLQGDPQTPGSTFQHLARAAAGAYSATDGSTRAAIAYHDVLIARGLGKSVEELGTLMPATSLAGGLALGVMEVLRQRPEVELAEESTALARGRLGYYENLAAVPRNQLFSLENDSYVRHWATHAEEFKTKQLGVAALAALGVLGASFFMPEPVRQFSFLGFLAAGYFAPRLSRKWVQGSIEKKIESKMRTELAAPQAYWQGQVAARAEFTRKLESYLVADAWQKLASDPDALSRTGVADQGSAVVVGGVRVRKKPSLVLEPAASGPSGFDVADGKGPRT